MAVGAGSASKVGFGNRFRIIKFSLKSNASGDISATHSWNDPDFKTGTIRQILIVPSAANAPSDLFDLTMTDQSGAGTDDDQSAGAGDDILGGDGANMSNSGDGMRPAVPYVFFGDITLIGAAMGNGKTAFAYAYCYFDSL